MTQTRTLGRSGIEVSALGFGCWAIGGPFWAGEQPLGWGAVDDDESIQAIHRALDLGVTFFDTASNYGAGHSERVLGKALQGRRDDVVIASKFGYTFIEESRQATGEDGSVAYMLSCLDGVLSRLGTDYLDLYQLHLGGLPIDDALLLIEPLEELVAAGKIRAYGWSTDDPQRAAAFARAGRHCTSVQFDESVLNENAEMVTLCETDDLGGINKGPLAMGLLSGKYQTGLAVGQHDIRGKAPEWLRYFDNGVAVPEWAAKVDAVRDILTSSGRTMSQGALAWLWARSPKLIPIPGIRTVSQAAENAGALSYGPLTEQEFAQVQSILHPTS
ncbi:aldo/keto reductase [Catelliglobosispora koreensis]|uniref:aldo/keto reductase n=1 Tax=Catelliglobosispora koreensis TaxID=129052 RepID=UPI00036E3429|nr:aldo/keto reductase [Catelliglobosispora koreensis]